MTTRESIRSECGIRRLPIVSIVTYGIALLAWTPIIRRWLPMPGMVPGLRMSDPGAPEAMAIPNRLVGVGLYLFMWGVMMVAMMYPSSVPLFRMYYNALDETTRQGTTARVGAFMGTYALVWATTGVIPLAVDAVVPIAAMAN